MSDKKWYVVRVIGGQENKAKKYLDSEISIMGLGSYIEEVLVPMEKVYHVKNGKRISREKVYFPGYMMVHANLTGEIPHIIKSMPSVLGFLSENKNGDPMPIRKNEVNRMLGKVDEFSTSEEAMDIPYVVGESVKVMSGPFNGFNGVIEVVNKEKRKLEVMVLIFGRKTPLELDFNQVFKV